LLTSSFHASLLSDPDDIEALDQQTVDVKHMQIDRVAEAKFVSITSSDVFFN